MTAPNPLSRSALAWRSGLISAICLGVSVPVLLAGLVALTESFPLGHNMQAAGAVIGLVLLLAGLGLAGALWGRSLARLAGLPNARRVAWASGLAFGPLTVAAMVALGRAEVLFVEERLAGDIPIHVVFAVLFTVAAFVVTFGMALAADWATNGPDSGIWTPLWAGLVGALAFLLADIVQDMVGRRVGAPGAERTATMLTVAFIGNIIAAFAGGTVMGWRLRGGKEAIGAARAQPREAIV